MVKSHKYNFNQRVWTVNHKDTPINVPCHVCVNGKVTLGKKKYCCPECRGYTHGIHKGYKKEYYVEGPFTISIIDMSGRIWYTIKNVAVYGFIEAYPRLYDEPCIFNTELLAQQECDILNSIPKKKSL